MRYCKLLPFLLLFSGMISKGQSTSKKDEFPLVQTESVTDWGHKIMMYGMDYWTDDMKLHMLTQMSEREFEKVKSSPKNTPCAMTIFCGKKMKSLDSLNFRLSKLKLYKIATYVKKEKDHNVSMAVIRVPYEGNESWDEDATWDTAYFLIPDKYIREVGPGFVQKTVPEKFCFPEVSIRNAKGALPFNYNLLKDINRDDTVVKQVGSDNMTHLRVFYGKPDYPKMFYDSAYKNKKEYNKSLSKLKAYQVARFAKYDEQTKKTEKYVILRIPYKGNEDWASAAKWDTNQYNSLFLVLPQAAVKETSGPCIDNFKIRR